VFFRKVLVNGRFVRAGMTFCAETPDKKAHTDFSVVCDSLPWVLRQS